MKKRYLFLTFFAVCLLSFFGYLKYNQMNINDLVFSLRAWVKKIKGGSVDFSELGKKNTLTMAHEKWNKLVQNHVSKDGNVDYRGFQSDSAQLDQYLEELSSHPPGKNWTEKEQLAYWINAYNAFTVKLIVDHYPVKSIKDIGDKKGSVSYTHLTLPTIYSV